MTDIDRPKVNYPPANIGDFCIVATPGAAYCEFVCYECTGLDKGASGEFDIPIYERQGTNHHPDPVTDIAEAQVFLKGSIKWDGCANLDCFDDGYIHLCGRRDAAQIGKLINQLYDLAAKLIPDWNEECAQ
jgi:hypothetical protein